MEELQLTRDAAAPRSARRWLRQQMHDDPGNAAGTGDVADIAELLLTEVVTNAVVHAGTGSTVRLVEADGLLCLEVQDGSPFPPRRRRHRSEDDESGRGVELLDTLAQRWGVRRLPVGKIVWFCLTTQASDLNAP